MVKKISSKVYGLLAIACLSTCVCELAAQPIPQDGGNQRNIFNNPGLGNQNQGGNAVGGAAQADFDTLIELIQTTVAPNSWEDVGGTGSIQGFPGGVFVNAKGVMQKVDARILRGLEQFYQAANLARSKSDNRDVFQPSKLRKVSLRKLQSHLQKIAAKGEPASDAAKYLAGIKRIDYLLMDEETEDVIVAGPAGNWMTDSEGRIVNVSDQRPVLHLDDLVVLLRNTFRGTGEFSCSITPSQQNLKTAQEYIKHTSQRPLKVNERGGWLDGLRDSVGNQPIEVAAIPAGSRLARTIVEADYHMKLIGIGLEPGTDGVVSYLDSMDIEKGESPPPVGVLRWWFTLNDSSIGTNSNRDVFELKQQAVQVLSENELLTKQGRRIHTGESNRLNREFASSFTKHFASLAKRYPIYAELENIFELALVTAILQHDDIPARFDWSLGFFLDPKGYQVQLLRAPQEVPTVVNHRIFHRKHIVAAVSGGVSVSGRTWLASHTSMKTLDSKKLLRSPEPSTQSDRWWWD